MNFLDTLSKTLSTGVDRARFEAEKFQRTSRISGEISNVKSQVDTNMRQLGERAFELYQQGKIDAPEIASLTQVITQLQAQQAEKERELGEAQSDTFDLWLARQPQPAPSTPDQDVGSSTLYEQTSSTSPTSTSSAPSPMNNGAAMSTPSNTATNVPPFAGATGGQPAVNAAPYACSNCGYALPANAIFCPNCGTRVAQA